MNTPLPLSALPLHQSAEIVSNHHTGAMRRRLHDIGFLPGETVVCVGRSPGGDPTAYQVRGAVYALRGSDSRRIDVEKRGATWD